MTSTGVDRDHHGRTSPGAQSDEGLADLELEEFLDDQTSVALRFALRMPDRDGEQTLQLCFHPSWRYDERHADGMVHVHFATRNHIWMGSLEQHEECLDENMDGFGGARDEGTLSEDEDVLVLEMATVNLGELCRLLNLQLPRSSSPSDTRSLPPSPSPRASSPSDACLLSPTSSPTFPVLPQKSRPPQPQQQRLPQTSSPSSLKLLASFALGLVGGLVLSFVGIISLWTWWQQPFRAHLDTCSSAIWLSIAGPPCPPTPLHKSVSALAVKAAHAVTPLVTYSDDGKATTKPAPWADRLAELHTTMHSLCLFAQDAHGRHDLATMCKDYTAASAGAKRFLYDAVQMVPAYMREAQDNVSAMLWALQSIEEQFAASDDGNTLPEDLKIHHHQQQQQQQQQQHSKLVINATSTVIVDACLERVEVWKGKHQRLANMLDLVLQHLRTMQQQEDRLIDGFEYELGKQQGFSNNQRIRQRVTEALSVLRKGDGATKRITPFLQLVEPMVESLSHVKTGLDQCKTEGDFIRSRSVQRDPTLQRWLLAPWSWRPFYTAQCFLPALIDMRWDLLAPEKELKRICRK